MEDIVKISEEIFNVYNLLKNNNISKDDKDILLNKLKELVKKEDELFNKLEISMNMYDDYKSFISRLENSSIRVRLDQYLTYLYGVNKVCYDWLIYSECNPDNSNYYLYFELNKELEKIIIKNNPSNLFVELFGDKLLEKEYIDNDYAFVDVDLKGQLSKKEYQMYLTSKYNFVDNMVCSTIITDDLEESFYEIAAFLELDKNNYDKHCTDIINKLSKTKDKDKLDEFIKVFGNRNKIK